MAHKTALVRKKQPLIKVPIVLSKAEAEVVRVLRKKGQTSRTEIAHVTGWSRAKTSQEVNSLIEKEYLKLIAIRHAVLRRSLPLAITNLAINFSQTGSDAGVMGAIMLALEYPFVVEDGLHFSLYK